MSDPILFDEFFDSNKEESVSPFLTPSSRRWSVQLPLRVAILSALLLICAYLFPSARNLLLLFIYFIAGVPKLIDAIEDILSFQINIDVLMTLAAFLSILIDSALEGALLLVLFAISGSLESAVTARARSAIRSLHKLSPTRAVVVEEGGRLIERNLADIEVGTTLLIKAGEIVPLDGVVIEGSSALDLSHLTGENLPISKGVEDEVEAGARNLDGTLTIRVTHTSGDSTLSRIIGLVTRAQEAKPKFQRWVDRLSRGYAITIITLTFLFALTMPLVMDLPYIGAEGSIYRSLAFLIAASPCALIIALPIAYLSAIGACARNGVLLKGGVTLDALHSCRAVAFDKTGTLTLGHLTCLGIELVKGEMPREQVVGAAAALERSAVHPIAQAIMRYAEEEGVEPLPMEQFRSLPGLGLEGQILLPNGPVTAFIGRAEQIEEEVVQREGELTSILRLGEAVALFRFQDTPRPGVRKTLQTLRERWGLRLLMLTGDHHANAKGIAAEVGIDEFHADLRPEDKLKRVGELSEEMGLAMVGDGINDGPALARATTGISMGKVGSQTAIDASDIVLLQDRLEKLCWLWNKAGKTQQVVRQNIGLSMAVIAGASIAALLGWVPLWLAVVLHEGGTVLVGLNGLRLLR